MFRGVRIIVHSRFDLIFQNGAAAEDMSDVICRGTTASIPPAEFRLYHVVGSTYAGQQNVHVFSSSKRSSAKASTRRADKDQGAGKKIQRYRQTIVLKESFLLSQLSWTLCHWMHRRAFLQVCLQDNLCQKSCVMIWLKLQLKMILRRMFMLSSL